RRRHRPAPPAHRDHRGRAARRRTTRAAHAQRPARAWRAGIARRFRHRLLGLVLPAPVPDPVAQDRPELRCRARRRHPGRKPGPGPRDPGPGQHPGHRHDRRGHRDAGPARHPARARLPVRPGLPLRQARPPVEPSHARLIFVMTQSFPKRFVYPFFLVHMLMFGVSGFVLAYGADGDVGFLYMHGGMAIVVYTVFYVVIFGVDAVRWMFINAALGLMGIYSQIGWILGFFFGRNVGEFPWYVHAIPVLYYVLYTFLLRQLVLDLTRSRDNPARRRWVEAAYILLSLALYAATLILR